MVDAESVKAETNKAPKTPRTPEVKATGTKTLFVGNLAFSVQQADVEDFFKDVGEVAGVLFASDGDGNFRGFGHVDFATLEGAQKAIKLDGQNLLGCAVKLDFARERGAYTPSSSNENSYQMGGEFQVQTIFVRGFDTSEDENKIRTALREHFETCGDISRMSVPKDYESGAMKGIAYMDFKDSDAFNKALELNGSEFGGSYLSVEKAKPRGDSGGDTSGRFSNRSNGNRFGNRDGSESDRGGPHGRIRGRPRGPRVQFGNRSNGNRFGNRDGSESDRGPRGSVRGGPHGSVGGGPRGSVRGGPTRPSMATAGTGKKTIFDD